jgi:hypothetical protein
MAAGKLKWFEPELAGLVLPFHMNVWRLTAVEAREEEPIRSRNTSDSRHPKPALPPGTRHAIAYPNRGSLAPTIRCVLSGFRATTIPRYPRVEGTGSSLVTVTIQLPSDIEADLVAQARDHGLELAQYVESLLRGQVSPRAGSALSPAERAAAWRESARGLPHTPPLSDDVISRDSIYGDRGR